jgi:hypothetical protein
MALDLAQQIAVRRLHRRVGVRHRIGQPLRLRFRRYFGRGDFDPQAVLPGMQEFLRLEPIADEGIGGAGQRLPVEKNPRDGVDSFQLEKDRVLGEPVGGKIKLPLINPVLPVQRLHLQFVLPPKGVRHLLRRQQGGVGVAGNARGHVVGAAAALQAPRALEIDRFHGHTRA